MKSIFLLTLLSKAVIVQPVSDTIGMVLAADKARPMRGDDFGWLEAMSDRLASVMREEKTC